MLALPDKEPLLATTRLAPGPGIDLTPTFFLLYFFLWKAKGCQTAWRCQARNNSWVISKFPLYTLIFYSFFFFFPQHWRTSTGGHSKDGAFCLEPGFSETPWPRGQRQTPSRCQTSTRREKSQRIIKTGADRYSLRGFIELGSIGDTLNTDALISESSSCECLGNLSARLRVPPAWCQAGIRLRCHVFFFYYLWD